MHRITYQAEEMNLLPAVPNAQVVFNGNLDLDAKPDGSWKIEDIWIDIASPVPGTFRTEHALHKLLPDNLLHGMVIKAAEAHDRATGEITDHVLAKFEENARADYDDHRRQLGKDIARGLEAA
jgi:hypothetical protein